MELKKLFRRLESVSLVTVAYVLNVESVCSIITCV